MTSKSNSYEKRPHELAREAARRAVAASRAEQGWTWSELSEVLRRLGISLKPNNLSTKHSRGAFRASEFLIILRALDVQHLDLSKLDVPGLKQAVTAMKRRRHRAARGAER